MKYVRNSWLLHFVKKNMGNNKDCIKHNAETTITNNYSSPICTKCKKKPKLKTKMQSNTENKGFRLLVSLKEYYILRNKN